MKKIIILFVSAIIISCSSAPKRPAEIIVIRRQAEQELELGNTATAAGQFENALAYYNEAKRKAISVDDPSLIIRTSIARGNVLLQMDRVNEAFEEWNAAITEARRINNSELLALSTLYQTRGLFLLERASASSVLPVIERELPNLKNRYYIAFYWQFRGLVLRAAELYSEAETALMRSLEIHEKDRYLEDASYDWYIIASVRSLSGNYEGAVSALESSIEIDRRIENSWGLVSSWRAMGDVLTRMGRETEAREAYNRAEAIKNAVN